MMLKTKYLVFFSLLLFSSITQPVANTNDRVKGVSEFLMGRFQENYFYIFELRLKENELFRQYFPVTYGYAASGDLKYLLRADNGIWEESIEADIKKLATKYMAQFFYSELLNSLLKEEWVSEHTSKVREMESLLTVVDNGLTTELGDVLSGNIKYTGSNIEVKKIAIIYRNYANAMHKLQLEEIVKSKTIKNIMARISNVHRQVDELRSYLGVIEESAKNKVATGWLIKKNKAYKISNYIEELDVLSAKLEKAEKIKQKLEKLFEDTFKEKSFFHKLAMSLTNFDKKVEKKEIDYVTYVWQLEKIIRDSRQLIGLDTASKEYRRFKQYIFFFAQLSKPRSSEQVKSLLQEVTLPAVSFGIKRERHEHQLLITSYLGYGVGMELSSETGEKDKSFGGLVAPVGIEYNYGLASKGSFSIMYAPFDFAYPINLELQEDEREVSLSDVIVHGLYITYGLADSPLAWGLGVSKGKSIRRDDRDETKVFLFFAMDMPLFELY